MSQGNFGIVQETQNQKIVSKRPRIITGRYLASFKNEVRIYKILDSIQPQITCIPHFYGFNSIKNDFTMQKIQPTLTGIDPTFEFFQNAFLCLSHLHQYILHMDLGVSNVGIRTSNHEIVFFDFGNSVTIEDLKKVGITNRAINLYREGEMRQLYEIFENMFPNKIDLINDAYKSFQKSKQQKISISQKIQLKQELFDKAHQIVFQNL